jgi:probable F420-dependent oxidoreductase
MRRAMAIPYWLDRPAREALEVAEAADAAGFDELWLGEMATFDAFALGGAIARTTSRVALTLGPLAVSVRDPVSLAMGVSSVSELGGRPAHLALGASSALVTRTWHGVDVPASLARFREVTTTCRQLFGGERAEVDGTTLHTSGFRLRLGAGSTTISIAAFGPGLLTLAAEIADRVVLAHVTPDQIRRTKELIDRVASSVGRQPPELVAWVQTGLGEAALNQIRRGLVSYVGARGYSDMFLEEGFEEVVMLAREGRSPRDVLAALPDRLVHAVAAVGTEHAVVDAITARRDAGADLIVMTPATAGVGGLAALLDLTEQPAV